MSGGSPGGEGMTPRYPNMQGVSEYAEDSSGDGFN